MGKLKIRDKNGKEIFKNEVDEELYKIYFEQDGFRNSPFEKRSVTTIRDITTKLDTYYYSKEESNRVPFSVRRGKQLIKKSRVKQAIIEFLKLHPKSRNGDIRKHTESNEKTKVSLKMFNNYLDELVVGTTVQKEIRKDRIYGDKYPRYSLTSQTRLQQIQIYLHRQWEENIDTIIAELEKDVFGVSAVTYGTGKMYDAQLAERIYFVYSILLGLVQKQEIMQEFSARRLLTNQKTYKSHPKRIVLTEIDRLFHILDKLPAKMRKAVLDEMIVISERDYYKILGPPEQSYRLTYWLHEKGIKFQLPTWWIGTPDWESFIGKQARKSGNYEDSKYPRLPQKD